MFINKSQDGSNNLCGRNVAALRKGTEAVAAAACGQAAGMRTGYR